MPALQPYIAIPNVSPAFDADWDANGHMERRRRAGARLVPRGASPASTVDVHAVAGRTPLIVFEIPATDPALADDTVLLYGHLDKQPEMAGWREGLGPWTPVLDGDRLYGRGGADDGYAAFAAADRHRGAAGAGRRTRAAWCSIEASEESGSPDLPAHLALLADRIGTPSSSSASTPAAPTTTGCGSPPRCAGSPAGS